MYHNLSSHTLVRTLLRLCILRLCIFGPKGAIQIRYYYYYIIIIIIIKYHLRQRYNLYLDAGSAALNGVNSNDFE